MLGLKPSTTKAAAAVSAAAERGVRGCELRGVRTSLGAIVCATRLWFGACAHASAMFATFRLSKPSRVIC